ncbi:protein of unknown function [Caballeronia sp. S22]
MKGLTLRKHLACSESAAHRRMLLRAIVSILNDAESRAKNKKVPQAMQLAGLSCSILAERTGLEPATPGVTGRYSNQLNYRSWVARNELRPGGC